VRKYLIEKPYQFVPPLRTAWPQRWLLAGGFVERHLARAFGVVAHECRQLDLLRESLQAGRAIVLCPNHPRQSDPLALACVARETPCPMYIMASWHLFNQGWFNRLRLRMMGAFSVYREGLDRQAIDEAIGILERGERPLLIFPEGTTSRTNDFLLSLMEGPAFIARTAAKRREKQGLPPVVVHPVALRYLFQGNLESACRPVLDEIEQRLTWKPSRRLPLIDRIVKVGNALLTLQELQYGLQAEAGATLKQRQTSLVNALLQPLEREWLGGPQDQNGIAIRVKNLRMKIFPDLSRAALDELERERRWRQLEDTYLAQQVDCYPAEYITRFPSVDRILEVVEKFEEDLADNVRVHGQMKVIVRVGPAIEVARERERKVAEDPLMGELRGRLESMLEGLQAESRLYLPEGTAGAEGG
jgi:1-acyl-sn-glycerol-3-phosphate acyltransferase